jgi:hypothetical protein
LTFSAVGSVAQRNSDLFLASCEDDIKLLSSLQASITAQRTADALTMQKSLNLIDSTACCDAESITEETCRSMYRHELLNKALIDVNGLLSLIA